MNYTAFNSLLVKSLSHTDIKVYPDYVPEKAKLPAVSYTHIANKIDKVKSGDITGTSDTWRVSIVGDTSLTCYDIVKQLKLLHMKSSIDFQRVLLISTNTEQLTLMSV